ncbi:hypothetical protein [Pseudomonas sp. NFPP24]|uniref:hypothetical protein n=1 Tax=Pseudomonas sp. NFPP24 TaxID=1566228 RepID=UPI0011134719|nr:hypothetical protein [Pseudomonas sp. NFPP24]
MNNPTGKQPRQKRIDVFEVHSNVSAEVVEITTEKLELILRQYVDCLSGKNSWQAPLGICLTIILVLLTSNFNARFGLSPDTWVAIFVISFIISLVWLVVCIVRLRKVISVDDLMAKVKNKI